MENNNGRRRRTVPKERVFGANSLKLAEDTVSKLMGGIVEKGISSSHIFTTPTSSSSFPPPSSLPFPPARHRSHGPHWAPATPAAGGGVSRDDFCEEDDGDSDLTNYESLANFANPMEKKKKKGLDFSKWKEVISSDIGSYVKEDGENSLRKGMEKQNAMGKEEGNSLVSELFTDLYSSNDQQSRSNVEVQSLSSPHHDVNMETENISSSDILVVQDKQPSATLGPNGVGIEQGHLSLESQIDAENRALLGRMSCAEIVEAQAEIRNRMNPNLLNVLKKRGLQKSLKQQANCDSGSDSVLTLGAKQAGRSKGEKLLPVPESSLLPATPTVQSTETKPNEVAAQDVLSKGSSKWNDWSKRVEDVRNFRFSLEGNVIEGSFLGHTCTTDNVAERDFLRTEGDPGAAGYTIKEALALARSVVPGQRAFALQLIASILQNALHNICKGQLDLTTQTSKEMTLVDWEAIWAYALGPEPELVLSLRLAMDDKHESVVLASVKVIQCLLACDLNEDFFNLLNKLARKDMSTAPVFRSRPDIKDGFLGGGFWKYSTKPSTILFPDEEVMNDNNEGEHTIEDDIVVANQDVAAGLVRMAILPRLLYLLETEPSAALEECILSILIAVARHSSTCANAIWKCEGLIKMIVNKFSTTDTLEFQGSKVKSVTLLRVLGQSSKTICIDFIDKGFFQILTWQLYRVTPSIDDWVNLGREKCKLASALMVEQIRFWKVCVMYGHCISFFTGFFPALCLWLNPPTFKKLTEANLFNAFASVTTEVFLALETLTSRLPDTLLNVTNKQLVGNCGDDPETWCWSDVPPMFDCALRWLELTADTTLTSFFSQRVEVDLKCESENSSASFLWILSAVLHFLHTVLMKAVPEYVRQMKDDNLNGKVLPEFVSKLALQIIGNGILNFSDQIVDECSIDQLGMGSFAEKLCYFRHISDPYASIASVWCLNALVSLVGFVDPLIQLTRDKVGHQVFQRHELGRENKILEDGIIHSSLAQWRNLLSKFANLVTSEWQVIHQLEVFGRGGPTPGVGVGWGALGGGFWSVTVITVQADSRLFIELLGTCLSPSVMNRPVIEEKSLMQNINSAFASFLMMGPGDKVLLRKLLDILLQVPILKYLEQHIFRFLNCFHAQYQLEGKYEESDVVQFRKILASHFIDRWFNTKMKKKSGMKNGDKLRNNGSLASIPEDEETTVGAAREGTNSLIVEWAHKRMPLPCYWLLSPITTIGDISSSNAPNTSTCLQDAVDFIQVAKAGLFFLLSVETMSYMRSDDETSPVRSIPLVWRLHSLSVPLLAGMGVLEEERSRVMYETLQILYGRYLDEQQFSSLKSVGSVAMTSEKAGVSGGTNCLKFQSEIHEGYPTFVETLVEQFASVSYGDIIYGRQIALYLHRQVDASVRLATWNALSNSCVLDLLPPMDKCISRAEGYLEPIEDNHDILEAYVKSWVSGALDKTFARGSMVYMIVIHHLSSFISSNSSGESLCLRNKLVKALLRDYSSKKHHETMMVDLILYDRRAMIHKSEQNVTTLSQKDFVAPRLELLKEACHGNSQLLTVVDNLKNLVSAK